MRRQDARTQEKSPFLVIAPGKDARLSRELLVELARSYPPSEQAEQLADVDRIFDHISLLQSRLRGGTHVIDLCGGIGLFSVGCAAIGLKVTLIDDFNDSNNRPVATAALELHRRLGVKVVEADILKALPEIEAASVDAVTCFDAI